jgi:hypothetical protein
MVHTMPWMAYFSRLIAALGLRHCFCRVYHIIGLDLPSIT